MKTMSILAWIVALLLTSCCVGCGSGTEEAAKPTDAPTEAPTEALAEATQALQPSPTGAEATPTSEPTSEPTATPTPTPAYDENGMYYKCPAEYLKEREGVTYGSYVHGTYHSDYCGRDRGYTVLLPAGYTTEKKYPVVYLLHGIFGDENSFAGDKSNKIPVIIGNMVADGLCGEFILVCPAMFAASDETVQAPGFTGEAMIPYDRFPKELVDCLIPYIDANYSTVQGREGTYIAGFSMGGRETLYTFLNYPDRFRDVCAIAPAPGMVPGVDKFMTHPGSMTEDEVRVAEDVTLPDKLIICCGTRDSVVGQFPKSYHELFAKNGIAHIWYEVPGADHDNNAIQSGLFNFLKAIGEGE